MTKEEKREMWRQRVADCQASGLSITAYCAQEGIAIPTLYYWRKQFADRRTTAAAGVGEVGFLPITVTPLRSAAAPVEIQLLSGRSLKLAAPLDAEWLQSLVRVLESPCG